MDYSGAVLVTIKGLSDDEDANIPVLLTDASSDGHWKSGRRHFSSQGALLMAEVLERRNESGGYTFAVKVRIYDSEDLTKHENHATVMTYVEDLEDMVTITRSESAQLQTTISAHVRDEGLIEATIPLETVPFAKLRLEESANRLGAKALIFFTSDGLIPTETEAAMPLVPLRIGPYRWFGHEYVLCNRTWIEVCYRETRVDDRYGFCVSIRPNEKRATNCTVGWWTITGWIDAADGKTTIVTNQAPFSLKILAHMDSDGVLLTQVPAQQIPYIEGKFVPDLIKN